MEQAVRRGPWLMTQTWEHVLFAHWPVPVDLIRPLVPEPLEIDAYEGQAWISVVAFRVGGVRLRGLPRLPYPPPFPQLNLRTYVTANGIPGVFFLALDAPLLLMVAGARLLFRVPFFRAEMAMDVSGPVSFASRRRGGAGEGRSFRARYQPASAPFRAAPGSLDAWLTERYRLYSQSPGNGAVCAGDVSHPPWLLCAVQAEILENTLAESLSTCPALIHYSRGVQAKVWPVYRLAGR